MPTPTQEPEPTPGLQLPEQFRNPNFFAAIGAFGSSMLIALGLAGEWLRRRVSGKSTPEKKSVTSDLRGDRKRKKVPDDYSDRTKHKPRE
jgi:hypothetical protein